MLSTVAFDSSVSGYYLPDILRNGCYIYLHWESVEGIFQIQGDLKAKEKTTYSVSENVKALNIAKTGYAICIIWEYHKIQYRYTIIT